MCVTKDSQARLSGLDVLCDPDRLSLAEAVGIARSCGHIDPRVRTELVDRFTAVARAVPTDTRRMQRIVDLLIAIAGRGYARAVCGSLAV
jgi:hypothetical protein